MKKRSATRRTNPPEGGDRKSADSPASNPSRALLTRERIERLPEVLLGGVAALLVATPLIPSEATGEGIETTLNVLWLLLLLGWGIGLILKRGQALRFGWTDAALAGLIGWHVLSGLVMGPQGNGRQTLNTVWQWVIYGVVFLLLRQLVLTPRQQRAIAAVMIAVAMGLTAHALYQYFYSGDLMRASFQRNPDKVLADAAWPIDGASPVRTLIENRIFSKEPLATFSLTNSLAGYLAPWLVLVCGLALLAISTGKHRLLACTLIIGLLLGGCLFLTKSRTGILATGVGMLLLLIYGPRRGWRVDWKFPAAVAALGVVLALGAVLVGGLDMEVLSQAPLSVRYRLEYWQATAAMIADYPLFGCGPGNFQEYYTHYKLPQASETIKDPHNFILEIWSSAGTPALLLLLGLAGAFVYDLRGRRVGESGLNDSLADDLPASTATAHSRATENGGEVNIDENTRGLRWIYGGAALGVLLSIPIGIITGYPAELSLIPLPLLYGPPVPLVLGLPIGALTLWMLRGWIAGGPLPRSLLVTSLLCLLINLLAAGAVTFPGVINTAWVLLALALMSAPLRRWAAADTRWAAAAIVLALALLLVFIVTAYRPVLNSATLNSAGDTLLTLGNTRAAERYFEEAAEADPWSNEPLRKLLDVRLKAWYDDRTPANWRRFEEAAERFIATDRQFYGTYESVAISILSAHGVEPTAARQNEVLDLLRRAVELYPNGAMIRAQYAWALHRAGKADEAARQAAEALRLDSMHNHTEQKLNALRLYDPSQPDVDPQGLRPETAEQSMKNLRNAKR